MLSYVILLQFVLRNNRIHCVVCHNEELVSKRYALLVNMKHSSEARLSFLTLYSICIHTVFNCVS